MTGNIREEAKRRLLEEVAKRKGNTPVPVQPTSTNMPRPMNSSRTQTSNDIEDLADDIVDDVFNELNLGDTNDDSWGREQELFRAKEFEEETPPTKANRKPPFLSLSLTREKAWLNKFE